jgi:hypothetical protein
MQIWGSQAGLKLGLWQSHQYQEGLEALNGENVWEME